MGAFDAWVIPGWTAQNPSWLAEAVVTPGIALPENLAIIEVTGQYAYLSGIPINGRMTFICADERQDATSSTVILPGVIQARLKDGRLSVLLPATNDPDVSPNIDITYQVIEHFPGGRKYKIAVPFDAVSPVDIKSLVVA